MHAASSTNPLDRVIARARRRLFLTSSFAALVQAALIVLPAAALLIAADQRWNTGRGTGGLLFGAICVMVVPALIRGRAGLGERVRSALVLDSGANLKDRVSSAYEFLEQGPLDAAQKTQVSDALQRAERLDVNAVVRLQLPRFSAGVPVAALLLALAFFVPPVAPQVSAIPARDSVKDAQLAMLDQLTQDLGAREDVPEEVTEAIEKLKEVQKQYARGEIGERDLMLQLGRLDEALRSKAAQLGVENLESEMNALVPHLAASAATAEAAKALQEQKLEKAADALEKLGKEFSEGKLSPEERKKLAAQLGTAATKFGKKKSSDSFGGDLAKATESLENSDHEGFQSACKAMGQKLGLLSKCKGLKSACNKLGVCKSGLSQCDSRTISQAPKTLNKNKGGKGAGTGASGDPLGEANRLGDALKQMVKIAGQGGAGPVETQTELTEGQMSQSQLSAKEVHAQYAAVAEEVIDKEDIPLSHRYHVKRYFQAIRPQD